MQYPSERKSWTTRSLALSALLAAVLAGCGGAGGSGSDAAQVAATDGSADTASALRSKPFPSSNPKSGTTAPAPAPTTAPAPAPTTAPAPAPAPTTAPAPATNGWIMGVNSQVNGMDLSQNTRIATIMKERNLKSLRIERFIDLWDVSGQRDLINKVRANGGHVQMVLEPPYQTTKDTSCRQDLAAVEQENYNYAYSMIDPFKDIVRDFELLNEVQHRTELVAEVPYNSAYESPLPYNNKPCHATLAAVMRGMSRAIVDIRASSGQPLRSIVGLIGKDFGLLTWLNQQGVRNDIVGYHAYPYNQDATLDTDQWMGPNGQLGELAKFGKPIHMNEWNCGEIYMSSYGNFNGDPTTELCLKGLTKHTTALKNQTLANIEEVHMFQIRDEPTYSGAEARFGLYYDSAMTNPKVNLFLVSAFAGGTLTTTETNAIVSRGLLTQAQIDGYRTGTSVATSTTGTTSTSCSTAPTWDGTTVYKLGDRVLWMGVLYESYTTEWNQNSRPDWTPQYWKVVSC